MQELWQIGAFGKLLQLLLREILNMCMSNKILPPLLPCICQNCACILQHASNATRAPQAACTCVPADELSFLWSGADLVAPLLRQQMWPDLKKPAVPYLFATWVQCVSNTESCESWLQSQPWFSVLSGREAWSKKTSLETKLKEEADRAWKLGNDVYDYSSKKNSNEMRRYCVCWRFKKNTEVVVVGGRHWSGSERR